MLSENIKQYRKAKGLSQEELAVRLYVVRQTVSKWEKGLSVPDADVLIRMADILEVPVSKILGAGDGHPYNETMDAGVLDPEKLAEELARLNEELARSVEVGRIAARGNEKRNLILFCSFGALAAALFADNEMVSAVLAGAWMLAAAGILYRNLALLSGEAAGGNGMRALKMTTVCSVVLLLLGIGMAVLTGLDLITMTEHGEKMFAMAVIFCVMVFSGLLSPKLPFTRHTGLRLPWTVRDEDTWNVCHRVLGYTALPLALIYVACGLTIDDFEGVTLAVMLAWIGIPGGISYVYYQKKMQGKLYSK
ncbi:MAG: XRE family transcriptional regulator [Firmicutes bacterium]|nr:XRE family transcriptional regulator [Bacillota bacterium]